MVYILAVFFATTGSTYFTMEILLDAVGGVPDVAKGRKAPEETDVAVDYTFYFNLGAFLLTKFLGYVYRIGVGATVNIRDPVCRIRVRTAAPGASQ